LGDSNKIGLPIWKVVSPFRPKKGGGGVKGPLRSDSYRRENPFEKGLRKKHRTENRYSGPCKGKIPRNLREGSELNVRECHPRGTLGREDLASEEEKRDSRKKNQGPRRKTGETMILAAHNSRTGGAGRGVDCGYKGENEVAQRHNMWSYL